jgi:hypothetical protein
MGSIIEPLPCEGSFAVRFYSLPCIVDHCRAPAHGKVSLPCSYVFAVRQGTAMILCHVQSHGKAL